MRFIHTADWHLGRVFHGRSLLEDQAHVLEQLIDLVADFKPDALLVAGDVFDRPVASADAMRLLDDVLSRIVLGIETPVIMIAGNHDSGSRLAHCAGLLRKQGFHVFGAMSEEPERVTFEDEHGPLHVVPFPFVTPAEVRQRHGDVELGDHDGAFQALSDAAGASCPAGERVVALAHTFVDGGLMSDSERLLSIGGVAAVKSSRFDRFCYSALGHLHRPQSVVDPTIRYAGSLLKYSGKVMVICSPRAGEMSTRRPSSSSVSAASNSVRSSCSRRVIFAGSSSRRSKSARRSSRPSLAPITTRRSRRASRARLAKPGKRSAR